eukprot:6685832-Heterocapsa_arctica.AAC.1
MGGGEISAEDLKRDCRNKRCVTCAARDPSSGYNNKEYGIQGSAMLKLWTDMKRHLKYKDWDTTEKLDRLCAGIATQPLEYIKELSKMGAVRMSRNE